MFNHMSGNSAALIGASPRRRKEIETNYRDRRIGAARAAATSARAAEYHAAVAPQASTPGHDAEYGQQIRGQPRLTDTAALPSADPQTRSLSRHAKGRRSPQIETSADSVT